MQVGSITSHLDVAQLTLYAFFLFFAGLVFYLRREDKREGYPLESERSPHISVEGFPGVPSPKSFLLRTGEVVLAPKPGATIETVTNAVRTGAFPGAPLEPLGNKLLSGIGPAAYAQRADVPDKTFADGSPRIVPLRADALLSLALQDVDPRGLPVVGADNQVAGHVSDVWVDRSEGQVRYLEIALATRSVLVPSTMVDIQGKAQRVKVVSILASQFADVPALKHPEQITLLEEDKITAYYGAGTLYATPARMEPLI